MKLYKIKLLKNYMIIICLGNPVVHMTYIINCYHPLLLINVHIVRREMLKNLTIFYPKLIMDTLNFQ